jgi:phenylalanyl-tRNA synthetase alpha subunit
MLGVHRRISSLALSSVRRLSTRVLSAEELLASINTGHPQNNVSKTCLEKVGKNLHLQPDHPLNTIKTIVENYCNKYAETHGQSKFALYDSESPLVDTKSCFDDLLVPPDHVSRSRSDTYYVDANTVLRTHTVGFANFSAFDFYHLTTLVIDV